MKKLLVAAAFAATFAGVAPSAQACSLETCWFSAPVCRQVDCHHQVCFYSAPPSNPSFCIGG